MDSIAQANIHSARQLTDRIDVFNCRPANDLLQNRARNEAFCLAQPGIAYAIYFTDGGDLFLKSDVDVTVEWQHVLNSTWGDPQTLHTDNGLVHLKTPTTYGYWALLGPLD